MDKNQKRSKILGVTPPKTTEIVFNGETIGVRAPTVGQRLDALSKCKVGDNIDYNSFQLISVVNAVYDVKTGESLLTLEDEAVLLNEGEGGLFNVVTNALNGLIPDGIEPLKKD